MSIPPPAWDQFNPSSANTNNRSGPPLIFIPGTSLAFIDEKVNYYVLSHGQDNIDPPKLDAQAYLEVSNNKPGPNYKVINNGEAEYLLVLHPVFSAPGRV